MIYKTQGSQIDSKQVFRRLICNCQSSQLRAITLEQYKRKLTKHSNSILSWKTTYILFKWFPSYCTKTTKRIFFCFYQETQHLNCNGENPQYLTISILSPETLNQKMKRICWRILKLSHGKSLELLITLPTHL